MNNLHIFLIKFASFYGCFNAHNVFSVNFIGDDDNGSKDLLLEDGAGVKGDEENHTRAGFQ